jgi:hypothetical protein
LIEIWIWFNFVEFMVDLFKLKLENPLFVAKYPDFVDGIAFHVTFSLRGLLSGISLDFNGRETFKIRAALNNEAISNLLLDYQMIMSS